MIIAEAGVNHNGDIELAKKLIEVAADAGADFVKFQTFKADKIVSKSAVKAAYQIKNLSDDDTSQHNMLRKLELSNEAHFLLKDYSIEKKIGFLSSGFDNESIDFLDELEIPLFKIPSGEITNKPYLQNIAGKGKPIILSTGMATLGEIETAIEVLEQSGAQRNTITVLHCTTEYPAPVNEVNLRAMRTIGKAFKVKVGYSDHTEGIEIPLAAVAMGATVIEKHFTLDRNMEGPDHSASLNPEEFKKMVQSIRNIEMAMGNGQKKPTPTELKNKTAVRKSIVAAVAIAAGEVFTKVNLTVKRPGSGMTPMLLDQVLGLQAKRSYQPDELIEP